MAYKSRSPFGWISITLTDCKGTGFHHKWNISFLQWSGAETNLSYGTKSSRVEHFILRMPLPWLTMTLLAGT